MLASYKISGISSGYSLTGLSNSTGIPFAHNNGAGKGNVLFPNHSIMFPSFRGPSNENSTRPLNISNFISQPPRSNSEKIRKETREAPNITPYRQAASDQSSIVNVARKRIVEASADYAYSSAPTSPLKTLTGNTLPLTSHPKWLRNQNKCNQFVGDVLTFSGYAVPTFKMTDGSEHYVNAERMLKEPNYFARRSNIQEIKPGDIMVVDRPSSGENGAHVEIVTDFNLKDKTLRAAGALKNGAVESDHSSFLTKGRWVTDSKSSYITFGKDKIYFLKPNALLAH